jgi:hypothetical protein
VSGLPFPEYNGGSQMSRRLPASSQHSRCTMRSICRTGNASHARSAQVDGVQGVEALRHEELDEVALGEVPLLQHRPFPAQVRALLLGHVDDDLHEDVDLDVGLRVQDGLHLRRPVRDSLLPRTLRVLGARGSRLVPLAEPAPARRFIAAAAATDTTPALVFARPDRYTEYTAI